MSSARQALTVFLCHAQEDKPHVRELFHLLTAQGFRVWLDEKDLLPGQAWQLEIERALRRSDVVVACLSRVCVSKEGFVHRELRTALDLAGQKPEDSVFVIPARLEECRVPDRLTHLHWVDLFEPDGFAKLTKSLILCESRLRTLP